MDKIDPNADMGEAQGWTPLFSYLCLVGDTRVGEPNCSADRQFTLIERAEASWADDDP
jgi:hypothetical protein